MPSSDVDICNMALLRLGANRISSLADGSNEGIACTEVYATLRDTYLASFPWSFATQKGAQLTPLAATPPTEWGYQFDVPSDLLALLRVHDSGFELAFEYSAGKRIFTQQDSNVYVDYIRKVDEGALPDYFVRALAAKLAVEICMAITGSASLVRVMADLAFEADRHARHIDSKQQPARAFRTALLTGHR